ncbi:MAG: rod shape-determining protein MreD [Planctomycetes bacterium RBG_13_62_9]|nr:MAG: rod shape-determining protein MreD [Planctomycetes bacterium RBG_13_62_9]
MRWFRFAVLVLIASLLQTSLVDAIAIWRPQIKPDLLLILLVFFAVRARPTDAIISSFAIGFMADLTNRTMGLMGPQIISFGLFGTLLSDLSTVISPRRLIYQAAVIFITGCLTAGLSYLLMLLRARAVAADLSAQFLWQPLYSAMVGPVLFLPVGWWMHLNERGGRRSSRRSLFR